MVSTSNLVGAALEVEQEIGDDLAGAVVGDLAAAVDAHHGNAGVGQPVLGIARQTQGDYRRMRAQPDFVRRGRVAAGGEFLHRGEGRRVLDATEVFDDEGGHGTTLTHECELGSR